MTGGNVSRILEQLTQWLCSISNFLSDVPCTRLPVIEDIVDPPARVFKSLVRRCSSYRVVPFRTRTSHFNNAAILCRVEHRYQRCGTTIYSATYTCRHGYLVVTHCFVHRSQATDHGLTDRL